MSTVGQSPSALTRSLLHTGLLAIGYRLVGHAYSADATSVVLGAFISAINSDIRRRARKRKLHGRLHPGSLTVVQRFGSSLNLNVQFHVIGIVGLPCASSKPGGMARPTSYSRRTN